MDGQGQAGQRLARPHRMSTARDRLEACLARIADPAGEGKRAFLRVYREAARASADAADARARVGVSLGPLDGAIVSIKDLFDVAGEPTTAGSIVCRDDKPAARDAPVVARLRRAGAILIGKTNMTEFAFSGIGMNPHYGTPGNPADRARIPGGSSSGAAVSVADGMAEIAIGSDTGGSVRIPAALCGLVGFKPTQNRVPLAGVFPLSHTLDSIGPLGRSVAECAAADAVIAGAEWGPLERLSLSGLRLALAQPLAETENEPAVAAGFRQSTAALERAGARLSDCALGPLLTAMADANARATFAMAEAFALHRERLNDRGGAFDPIVRKRILRGGDMLAGDYVDLCRRRAELVTAADAVLADIDALILPTLPIVAPRMADLMDEEAFLKANALLLRNPSIGNFFDLCAIALPVRNAGPLPVSLMLMGRHGTDRRLLRVAAAVEAVLS